MLALCPPAPHPGVGGLGSRPCLGWEGAGRDVFLGRIYPPEIKSSRPASWVLFLLHLTVMKCSLMDGHIPAPAGQQLQRPSWLRGREVAATTGCPQPAESQQQVPALSPCPSPLQPGLQVNKILPCGSSSPAPSSLSALCLPLRGHDLLLIACVTRSSVQLSVCRELAQPSLPPPCAGCSRPFAPAWRGLPRSHGCCPAPMGAEGLGAGGGGGLGTIWCPHGLGDSAACASAVFAAAARDGAQRSASPQAASSGRRFWGGCLGAAQSRGLCVQPPPVHPRVPQRCPVSPTGVHVGGSRSPSTPRAGIRVSGGSGDPRGGTGRAPCPEPFLAPCGFPAPFLVLSHTFCSLAAAAVNALAPSPAGAGAGDAGVPPDFAWGFHGNPAAAMCCELQRGCRRGSPP